MSHFNRNLIKSIIFCYFTIFFFHYTNNVVLKPNSKKADVFSCVEVGDMFSINKSVKNDIILL